MNKVKDLRKNAGMTQRQFAEYFAVPLTLWHYDRERCEYYSQPIITSQDAAMMKEGGWYA